MIELYNEDCFDTMESFISKGIKVDCILTSPPYNSSSNEKISDRSFKYGETRYDVYVDSKSQKEYLEWVDGLFNKFDKILNKDGVVLYNYSYNSNSKLDYETFWLFPHELITNTNFTIADRIIWKKTCAMPNNMSKNKLTRIVEDVFVICRKSEYETFETNKNIISSRPHNSSSQSLYEVKYNFVEAKNNNERCPYNKATFSVELCNYLLDTYVQKGKTVYDPFMGSGTTAVACKEKGINCYGSEISQKQCEWAKERLNKISNNDIDDLF